MKRVPDVKRKGDDFIGGKLDRGPVETSSRISKGEGEIMNIASRNVVTMPPTSTIMSVVKTMVAYRFRRLPITDAGTNRLKGIVTSLDIVDFLGGGEKHRLVEEKFDNNLLVAINEEISEIMEREVVTVNAEDGIDEALNAMIKFGLGGIPVVDREFRVTGIVTERDFVRYLSGKNVNGLVEDYMTKSVIYVEPLISIENASEIMVENGLRRLPVIKEGVLVGIFSATDIVKYLGSGEVFEKLITGDVHEAFRCPVKNIMTKSVTVTSPEKTIIEVSDIMIKEGFGGLPVLSDGDLVGIITERDLLRALI